MSKPEAAPQLKPMSREELADLILKPSGSCIRNYSMPKSRADILAGVDQIFLAGWEACREAAATVSRNGCLVPPDGGCPTEDERLMCEEIERRISNLTPPSNGAGNG